MAFCSPCKKTLVTAAKFCHICGQENTQLLGLMYFELWTIADLDAFITLCNIMFIIETDKSNPYLRVVKLVSDYAEFVKHTFSL